MYHMGVSQLEATKKKNGQNKTHPDLVQKKRLPQINNNNSNSNNTNNNNNNSVCVCVPILATIQPSYF